MNETPYRKMQRGKIVSRISNQEFHEMYGQELLEPFPGVPTGGHHVWGIFWSLSSSRASGFNGPSPLSFSEIKAWAELNGKPLRPLEVELIKGMDSAYLSGLARVREFREAEDDKK